MRDLYDLHAKLIGFLRAAVQTLRALEVCYFPELLEISRRPIQEPADNFCSSRLCNALVTVLFLCRRSVPLAFNTATPFDPTNSVVCAHVDSIATLLSRDLPARAPRSPRHITYHLANPIPPLRLFVL